jgi:hypothetical protein
MSRRVSGCINQPYPYDSADHSVHTLLKLAKLIDVVEHASTDAKEANAWSARARSNVIRATPRRFAACFSESKLGCLFIACMILTRLQPPCHVRCESKVWESIVARWILMG